MTREINIPEFLNHPTEYITQPKKDYENYLNHIVRHTQQKSYFSGFISGVGLTLIVSWSIITVYLHIIRFII